MKPYITSCHCGRIKAEILLPDTITVQSCNCSMCDAVGFIHIIVPKSQFRLLKGEQDITTYTFNTGVAKHTFCKHCGVKPFYTPRSNPNGYSVNLRCLETKPPHIITENFDGQNWEQHADTLKHLA